MLKRWGGRSLGATDPTVYLHLYSLGHNCPISTINTVLSKFNTGVYHAGIEVYGKEWSFLGCDEREELGVPPSALLPFPAHLGGGVRYCKPGQMESHTYRGKKKIGATSMTDEEVYKLLDTMEADGWRGHNYDVFTKNCCHFSEEFAERLGVPKLSFWVKSWARFWMRISAVHNKGIDSRMQRDYASLEKEQNDEASYKLGDFTRGIVCIGKNRRGAGITDKCRCGDYTCGLFRFCCVSQDAWDRGFVWSRSRTHRVLLSRRPTTDSLTDSLTAGS